MLLALLLTLSGQAAFHDAIAVASGGPGFAVVWEQQARVGAQREVVASLTSPNGYASVSSKLLDAGGEASELSAAWTGSAWTIAICNPAWGMNNDHAMLVWGELATDGTFTRQGEHDFGAGAGTLHCSQVRVDKGVPYLYASVREDERCSSRRFELVGRAPVIGPPRPVCRVWADAGGYVFGPDARGRGAMVDAHGNVSRAAVTEESDVRGATVVTRAQASVRFWDAPFTRPARAVALPLSKTSLDPYASAGVFATHDGGVAVVQPHNGTESVFEAVWFDKHGKPLGRAPFGTAPSPLFACATGEDTLYCAYADDRLGEVHGAQISTDPGVEER